jgi:hypothetical protein
MGVYTKRHFDMTVTKNLLHHLGTNFHLEKETRSGVP